jgi:hypothetical protein
MVRRNINVASQYHKPVISLMDERIAQKAGKNSTLV